MLPKIIKNDDKKFSQRKNVAYWVNFNVISEMLLKKQKQGMCKNEGK